MEKIKWKDLPNGARIGIVGGWIYLLLTIITFVIGFIIGLGYG